MRTTSSTRSAAPWMSGRQLGAVTFTVAPLPSTAKPSRSSVARICFSSSLMPPSFSTCAGAKLMTVLVSGGAPATLRLEGVPPATSSIMAVARSRPGRMNAGSTPRSKR